MNEIGNENCKIFKNFFGDFIHWKIFFKKKTNTKTIALQKICSRNKPWWFHHATPVRTGKINRALLNSPGPRDFDKISYVNPTRHSGYYMKKNEEIQKHASQNFYHENFVFFLTMLNATGIRVRKAKFPCLSVKSLTSCGFFNSFSEYPQLAINRG